MRVVYSARYDIAIGHHVYQTAKYAHIAQRLKRGRVIPSGGWLEPEPAAWTDLGLVHTTAYLRKLRDGGLSTTEAARLEVPWSEAITSGFRLMTGGTVTAARAAMKHGGAVHVGGGFHHAYAGHGEGFCMFNDVALAVRRLQDDGAITRASVIDCDVHHGNGTASIFATDSTVFTFSMHQENNYPVDKPPGTLDVPLADRTGDEEYLRLLDGSLPVVLAHRPDLVVYLAGADPFERDQLGGLAMTKEGLRERDRVVLEVVSEAGIPVVVTMAGGYAVDPADTVDIHLATIEEAIATDRVGGSKPRATE